MTRAVVARRCMALALAALMAGACSVPGQTEERAPEALAGATPGGTVTVGVTSPGSLDPAHATAPSAHQILSLVCEPLISFHPLTAKPVAGIVTSWVNANDGGLLSVQFRHGVRFHSGRKVKSEDVAVELSRVAKVDTASANAPILKDIEGYDEIHGLADAKVDEALDYLMGLQYASDDTLQISQDHNTGAFALLGHSVAAPVPADLAWRDDPRLGTAPDCAGPYRLAAPYRSGQTTITLTRFDGYYGKNGAHPRGGRGYLDTIVFKIYSDRVAQLKAFLDGEIDIAQVPEQVIPPTQVKPGSNLVSAANGHLSYVGFPRTEGSPLAKREVRWALSQAIDRLALARDAVSGAAQPASGFLPPTVGDTYRADACAATVPRKAAPAAAAASLTKAQVDLRGRSVKLYYDDEFANGRMAAAVAKQWQQAFGLKVQLAPLDWQTYQARAKSASGFDGAFIDNWAAPYPSAEGYLYPLFHSNQAGQDNYSRHSSFLIDSAFDAAVTTIDAKARALNYRGIEAMLCVDLPMAPLLFRHHRYLVRTGRLGAAVGSFTDASNGLLNLRDTYVKAGSE